LFEVDGALPNNAGLFIYGMAQTRRPFGDGTLCVGGSTFRLPISLADGTGSSQHALDYSNPPGFGGQIDVGST
jgi:hypothetical protein